MKLFGHRVQGFAKALVILVAVLLVSSGLCGLQLIVMTSSKANGDFLIPMGVIELAGIAASLLGILVTLLIWGVRALSRTASGQPGAQSQESSNDSRETKGEPHD